MISVIVFFSFMGREKEPITAAVVRFPGSNCDRDTLRFFQREGHNAQYLWHAETKTPDADLLVLPGGFAFGDRVYERATGRFHLDPGVQALKSPVMEVVYKWAQDKRPILGICNGFQIATHAGLLPGSLEENTSGEFYCNDVPLKVEDASFFESDELRGKSYIINVAHKFGRYTIPPAEYQDLVGNNQIFLRYDGFNPNGSLDNIAGITNKEKTIFGMMPHPERADPQTRSLFLKAIENYVRR